MAHEMRSLKELQDGASTLEWDNQVKAAMFARHAQQLLSPGGKEKFIMQHVSKNRALTVEQALQVEFLIETGLDLKGVMDEAASAAALAAALEEKDEGGAAAAAAAEPKKKKADAAEVKKQQAAIKVLLADAEFKKAVRSARIEAAEQDEYLYAVILKTVPTAVQTVYLNGVGAGDGATAYQRIKSGRAVDRAENSASLLSEFHNSPQRPQESARQYIARLIEIKNQYEARSNGGELNDTVVVDVIKKGVRPEYLPAFAVIDMARSLGMPVNMELILKGLYETDSTLRKKDGAQQQQQPQAQGVYVADQHRGRRHGRERGADGDKAPRGGGQAGGATKIKGRCWNCDRNGHRAADCRSKKKEQQADGQFKKNCFNCGKPGHRKAQCRAPVRSHAVFLVHTTGGSGTAPRSGQQQVELRWRDEHQREAHQEERVEFDQREAHQDGRAEFDQREAHQEERAEFGHEDAHQEERTELERQIVEESELPLSPRRAHSPAQGGGDDDDGTNDDVPDLVPGTSSSNDERYEQLPDPPPSPWAWDDDDGTNDDVPDLVQGTSSSNDERYEQLPDPPPSPWTQRYPWTIDCSKAYVSTAAAQRPSAVEQDKFGDCGDSTSVYDKKIYDAPRLGDGGMFHKPIYDEPRRAMMDSLRRSGRRSSPSRTLSRHRPLSTSALHGWR